MKLAPLSHVNIVTLPPQYPPVYNSAHTKIKILILWVFSDETWLRTPVKGYTVKKGEPDVTDQTLPRREIIFPFFYCSSSGTETCIEWVTWQFDRSIQAKTRNIAVIKRRAKEIVVQESLLSVITVLTILVAFLSNKGWGEFLIFLLFGLENRSIRWVTWHFRWINIQFRQ
jgi:hypothetical protein